MRGAKKRSVPRLTAGAVKTCKLIRAKQRLIAILWDDGEFLVTADHAVLVKKTSDWLVIEACLIQPGDELMLYSAPVAATKKVVAVKEYQKHQDVVEVTMINPAATLLVSSSSSTGPYVVVFGKQPNEPWSSDLWMMKLSRMPQEMDDALQANDSLQTCQCLSGAAEMKSGAKLFLLPDHVQAVEGLVRHGQLKLKGRDIIFSADYKGEIERAVRELPKKTQCESPLMQAARGMLQFLPTIEWREAGETADVLELRTCAERCGDDRVHHRCSKCNDAPES